MKTPKQAERDTAAGASIETVLPVLNSELLYGGRWEKKNPACRLDGNEEVWWNDNSDLIWDVSGAPSVLLWNEAKFL